MMMMMMMMILLRCEAGGGEGAGLLGLIFVGYLRLGLTEPQLHVSIFLANYRPDLRHFWANVIFAIPSLVTHFLLFMHLPYKAF